MIKSLTILGGGTSGLITALVMQRWYPMLDITVVESSTIGIVGVGEGSTEHWRDFMTAVGINLKELITETGATFKTGIKFENWNGDDTYYMHALHASYTNTIASGLPAGMLGLMANDAEHLTPDGILNSLHYAPLTDTVYQYHFDTNKLNTFFHKKCTDRNIRFIDADITDVVLDQEGFVSSLVDRNNVHYESDFFVDCSGFARIIGTKLGVKWIDCREQLPMNRAFAFPTAGEEKIVSHTLSRALSSGWNWKIPTQDRYGNGYVFSDEFLTEGQAIDEVQKYYDEKLDIRKSFKFSAGYVDKFWIKNCVCLGLSGSFVEPLEATSIGTSIQQAFALGATILNWNRQDIVIAKRYNEIIEDVAKNIIDFVQLHYITKRDDTEFWRSCKNIKLTEFNKEMIPYFRNALPTRAFFSKPFVMFSEQNWIQVLYGLKLINLSAIKELWAEQDPLLVLETEKMIADVEKFALTNTGLSHRAALNHIMSGNFR